MSSKKGPDPRSGIRKKFIPDPDPGSRIQGVKKHRIPDLQHWFQVSHFPGLNLFSLHKIMGKFNSDSTLNRLNGGKNIMIQMEKENGKE
jgi:hypothetical protein